MIDANDYRQHAAKIRHLVAGVRGPAATAALLLADEYEARAAQLEGRPVASAYVGTIDRIGELVAVERRAIEALAVREADLVHQLERTRHERVVADARIDAILSTARLLDMPEPLSRPGAVPPRFEEATMDKPDA